MSARETAPQSEIRAAGNEEPAGRAGLDRDLSSDDPTTGLRAVVALRELADQLEALHIERARDRGWSWQDIASVLGISKQAVHKKYGDRGIRPGAVRRRPRRPAG